MNKLFLAFLLSPFFLFAQKDQQIIDENYLEDQLYIGITYDLLANKPTNITQNGFSGGISAGFIKDLPINKKRTVGFGIGLGYSYDAFIQNLKIQEIAGNTQYMYAINSVSNRLSTHRVALPLEFRWRTSTPTRYKFWRIYSGLKFSYLLASTATYKDQTTSIKVSAINEIQKFQLGATTAIGYGTWNLFVYYGFTPLFKGAVISGESIDMKEVRIGLQFYIL